MTPAVRTADLEEIRKLVRSHADICLPLEETGVQAHTFLLQLVEESGDDRAVLAGERLPDVVALVPRVGQVAAYSAYRAYTLRLRAEGTHLILEFQHRPGA